MTATDGDWHQLQHFATAQVEGHPQAVVLALGGRDGTQQRFVVDVDTLELIADALAAELQRLRGAEVTH